MRLPPQYPVGPFEQLHPPTRDALVAEIEAFPAAVAAEVSGWSDARLDTLYKNWTARQIVHHTADSHVNAYIRFKWTLTEDHPTIKAYHEGDWAALDDSRTGDIAAPLALLQGVHRRWVQLMRTMTDGQWTRSFHHPESGEYVPLTKSLQLYAWHGRHHLGQLKWLREYHDW